jgi:triosephosphate isomerase
MYKTQAETRVFFQAFKPAVVNSKHCDIVIAPPYTAIGAAVEAVKGSAIRVAAQNLYWETEGAFTGEVSGPMIADAGCNFVIIGHSERRQYFGETDATVNRKIKAALAAELTPIVCIGETLAHREAEQTKDVLRSQCEGGFAALTAQEFSRILLAYEPVWAIGTGRTATPEIATEAHRHIRQLVAEQFSAEEAIDVRILYGGSVKPDNIRGLMFQPDIDGALVGGASLDPKSFAAIVNYQD